MAARTSRGPETSRSSTRSEEHTSELQSPCNLVCRLLLEKIELEGRRVDRTQRAAGDVRDVRARGARRVCSTPRPRPARTEWPDPITRSVYFFFLSERAPADLLPFPPPSPLPP